MLIGAHVSPAGGLYRAVERGTACRDDLSARWDHWAWVELPLEEVRARLGVAPLQA